LGEKTHTYEYDLDLASDLAPARVLRMVTPGSRVLEIGAGPGSITRHLTGKLGCSVVALEIDPAAIEILRGHVSKVHASDLNSAEWPDQIRKEDGLFDYVIAADVLEHVYDPWTVLDKMTSLLRPDGAIILSLPHVGHASVAACLVDEDFEYWPWGLLDRTHVRFFGIKNIQALINGAGLAIERAEFVVRTPEMTEFAARWRRMPKDIQAALQRNRFSHVLQVVTISRRQSQGQSGIDLMTLVPQAPAQDVVDQWVKTMRSQSSGNPVDIRSPLEDEPNFGPAPTSGTTMDRLIGKLRKRRG
jgi:2-polyprenyl-3-methyl-5-hydroxy-6-metoxy-1,4-benzoquinol methylase